MKRKSLNKNGGIVNEYGAYAVGLLGALGALVFAFFMPTLRQTIIGAAGTIALLTFFMTERYDAFVLRILGFVAAAACMVAAIMMPDYGSQLVSAAGLCAGAGLFFGDGDF